MSVETYNSVYAHTQRAPIHYLLLPVVAALAVGAWAARGEPVAFWLLAAVAIVVAVCGLSFTQLTIRDEHDALAIRFGPLPLFGKRIPYTAIRAVDPDRSTLIEGWGIHYLPGRGWIYNLWGFACVKITLDQKVIRVGSDDVENLVEFLRSKIGPSTS